MALSGASRVAGGARAIFQLAYPFVVYFAYTRLDTRGVGALLLVLYALTLAFRVRASPDRLWQLLRPHLGLALLIGLATLIDDRRLLLLLPMAVSLYLLWTFAWTLRRGPPMVERFARLVEEDLPDFTLPYCRKLTVAWCAFLALNAAVVGYLAHAAPLAWWTLYTGFVFYLLLGALLAAEFLLRKLWFRHYGSGLADRLLARLFPAERTANGRRSLAYVQQRAAALR